jgi:hypothetical protein
MVAECLDYFNPCGNKYHTEPILFSIEGKDTNVSPAANILSKIWTVKQQAETTRVWVPIPQSFGDRVICRLLLGIKNVADIRKS